MELFKCWCKVLLWNIFDEKRRYNLLKNKENLRTEESEVKTTLILMLKIGSNYGNNNLKKETDTMDWTLVNQRTTREHKE